MSAAPRVVLHTRVVTGSGGGPDKTILRSARFLRGTGYRAVCAYMRHPGDHLFAELARRAEELDAPLVAVDDLGPLDWRLPGRFRNVCRSHGPAIWHGHDYKSNLLGLIVRRSFPMRLVTTVHGWVRHTARTPLYYAIDRRCLPRYDEVICVSRDLYDRCLGIGVPVQRCRLIENAIDVDEFRRREEPAAAKRRLGVPATRLLLGAVGRLSAEKGLDLLVHAVADLGRTGVDCELWIAGEGDREAELGALARRLQVEDRVKLLGFRADCRPLYEAMDVFAQPSLREGLPNSLLEAMALRLPVVATAVGGVASLVEDGRNGLLVEPGSREELGSALGRLAADPRLREALGREARRTIERSYDFRDRMRKVREVYDRALDGQREVA